jgi:Mor family transcriptional regulator
MDVLHHCDNPPCVNPEHLFLGTHRDNMLDRVKKGRSKLLAPKGEQIGTSVLTSDQVRDIRRRYRSGESRQFELAKEYGVGRSAIYSIVHRVSWRHVEDEKESSS